jgi:hypothetical protein
MTSKNGSCDIAIAEEPRAENAGLSMSAASGSDPAAHRNASDATVTMRDGADLITVSRRRLVKSHGASALMRTEDSQRRRAVRVCWNGSDCVASPLGST